MPPSIPSFLRFRSLLLTQTPRPNLPESSYEHVNIATIDTPTHSLRSEVLIGFTPVHPHSLVTLSRPAKSDDTEPHSRTATAADTEIGLWYFHPGRPVRLLRRLKVEETPDYLPVAVVSTCFSLVNETYYQFIYRSATDDGEGCIEVRCLPLTGKSWSVFESVTEEDGLLGGVCWNLLSIKGMGYVTIATASRLYFFTEDTGWADVKQEYWTGGTKCLIFEVDIYLQQMGYGAMTRYATRLVSSNDKTISILVFVSQKSQLQSFRLEVCPRSQRIRVCVKTEIVQWKAGARAALLAWSMRQKMMLAHVCEDECGEKRQDGRLSILKTWFAREKASLKGLLWEYGGIIVDSWNS